jgi:hypothetical protein
VRKKCVTPQFINALALQEIAKPQKKHVHHYPKKKPHSHTTNVTYCFPAPHPSNRNQGKGHQNGKLKGHEKSKGKGGKKH